MKNNFCHDIKLYAYIEYYVMFSIVLKKNILNHLHYALHTQTHTEARNKMCKFSFSVMEEGLKGWSLILFRKCVFLTLPFGSLTTDLTKISASFHPHIRICIQPYL